MSLLDRLGPLLLGEAGGVPRDVGLLLLRLGTGLPMAAAHGWGKLTNYTERAGGFPDPLGVGSPVSMALVVFAEFFCSLGLAAGLLTRLCAVPVAFAMGVAFFVIHDGDPFAAREKALLFLMPALAIALTGPGRFSLDAVVFGRSRR